MQHDPEIQRLRDTRAWITKARHDLEAAARLLDVPVLLDIVAYHCQQAAEKALKAFLFWNDQPFRKTHDLEELLSLCIQIDSSLEGLAEDALILTPMATEFRYPGDLLEPPLNEVREALHLANKCLQAVLSRLPQKVREELE